MQKNDRILYVLALIKIIVPYLLQNPVYEPHRDEFLYLAEGHHLAWGFMEVPPVLSVFAWLTHMLGDGMFWIKLWPSLFGAATFFVAGKIVQSLGGRNFALLLLLLPFIFGAYLRLFFLFQPNPPEVFFCTMLAHSIIRFNQTKKNKWLYLFGISAGLGMMSKYTIAIFIVSFIIGLLATPQRKIFLNKHFWFASSIGFIIFLPNLIWQFSNHLPVMHHMETLQRTQLQYISPLSFLVDQLLMNLPCAFMWLAGIWFATFTKNGSSSRFVAFAYLSAIILLLLGHGKNYYALGIYPVLFALGAYQLEKFARQQYRRMRYVFVIIPFLLGLPFIPLLLPVASPQPLADFYHRFHYEKTGFLKWEDLQDHPLPQDFADMLGWEEMAKKMSRAYETLDSSEKKHTILFCDNYGQAGATTFYAKKYHLPEAYSANASFLYWMPDSMRIDNLLLLTDDPNEMQYPFVKNFLSAVVTDSVTSPLARERGDLIILLKGANEAFNQMFKEKIEKDRAAFK